MEQAECTRILRANANRFRTLCGLETACIIGLRQKISVSRGFRRANEGVQNGRHPVLIGPDQSLGSGLVRHPGRREDNGDDLRPPNG